MITPLQSRNFFNNPNFTSIHYRFTSYIDSSGRYRETQNTTSVRDDLDCKELAKIIKSNFKNKDKINLMPMNASDLTETYSITTALIDEMGFANVSKRIAPILATDVDCFVVNNFGKQGLVALTEKDVNKIGVENVDKYFKKAPRGVFPPINTVMLPVFHTKYQTSKKFKSLFEVKQMDLQKRIRKIKDDGNSIVLIRNCLAQSFGNVETKLLINTLGKKLKDGSLFVIGGYDRLKLPEMISDLKREGFHEIGENIFRKGNFPIKKVLGFKISSVIRQVKDALG